MVRERCGALHYIRTCPCHPRRLFVLRVPTAG
jgi:hypothetical protein